jgi:hypothetical protein
LRDLSNNANAIVGSGGVVQIAFHKELAMNLIFSALVVLSVLGGPARAEDAQKFWNEHLTSSER